MKIKYMPLGPMGANFCMVIDEESKEMLVADPGSDSEIISELIKESNACLKYIVITHAHTDHIGALDALKAQYDVPVVIHEYDAASLNDDCFNLCAMFGEPVPKTKADLCVSDGDVLMLGSREIKFLHTPGHTKGSMCILCGDSLISGDTLFRLSIGRTDFPGGSMRDIENSIKNKIYTLKPSTVIYPGHGDPTTVEYEIKNNLFVRGI